VGETVSIVAFIMWAGALTLIGFAARRRDDSLKRGLRIGGGYFVIMAPRMFLALFMAGFAAELLPGELISGWLGNESGFRGIMIASVAGVAVPAGGVVAFPLALAMYKIGVGIPQLTAFLTTWEIFAIHRMIAWELPFLGSSFVLLRVSSSFMLPPLAGVLAAQLMTLLQGA
jgi:uncharacterized membrane protein YraQ (UPF0718 family)